jgi:hypothetical protein
MRKPSALSLWLPLELLLLASSAGWVASCASHNIQVAQVPTGTASQARLFPYGNYKHKVSLTVTARPDTAEKKFNFTGIVQLKADAIRIVVLSDFGMTAFKINENLLTGDIQTEVFVPQMKKFEPRIREYYLILREILLAGNQPPTGNSHLKWIKANEQGLPLEIQTVGLEQNATFKLSGFDKNKIPTGFSIEHPHFEVDAQVAGYDF